MLITSLLFSTSGLFVKLLDENVYTIAGFRALFALLPFLVIYRKQLLKVNARMWVSALLYGCTCMFFVISTKTTTAANAIFLQFTAPIYVLIAEPLMFGLKYKRLDILTVLVCFLGMFFFFQDNLTVGNMTGNIIALISGMTLAGFILNQRKNEASYQAPAIFWGNAGLALVSILLLPKDISPSVAEWGMLLFLGIFQIGIAFSLFTYALKRVLAVEISLLGMLEPVLNPIWVAVGYGELPGLWAIVGGSIILGMLIIRTLLMNRKNVVVG